MKNNSTCRTLLNPEVVELATFFLQLVVGSAVVAVLIGLLVDAVIPRP